MKTEQIITDNIETELVKNGLVYINVDSNLAENVAKHSIPISDKHYNEALKAGII